MTHCGLSQSYLRQPLSLRIDSLNRRLHNFIFKADIFHFLFTRLPFAWLFSDFTLLQYGTVLVLRTNLDLPELFPLSRFILHFLCCTRYEIRCWFSSKINSVWTEHNMLMFALGWPKGNCIFFVIYVSSDILFDYLLPYFRQKSRDSAFFIFFIDEKQSDLMFLTAVIFSNNI